MAESEKLSVTEKLGYSLGDCAANFVFQTQLIFMMSFYTDVFGISASIVGTMFLVSRFLDAVDDPIMGAIADRTNTRWGKFRPWVLWTALPFAVCFVLAYTTPDLSYRGKVLWAYVTYNLLMLTYTANNIPYSALTGVITGDRAERTSLVSWRFILAMVAGFLVQTFTLDLVKFFGGENNALGYKLAVGLWAVLAVIFFVITFLTTKERVQPDPLQKSSFTEDIRDLLRNRPWIALSILTVFLFIYLAMRGGTLLYYFRYIVQREDLFGMFNGIGMLATMVGILLSKPISQSIGKRNTFLIGSACSTLLTAMFFYLPTTNIGGIFALQVVLQLAYGVAVPMLWAMMADVADYSEWINGRRATAMTFAATVFALKLGLSIGGAISGWLLDFYHYVPNVSQSQETLRGILLMVSYFPAMAFAAGVVALLFYEIDRPMELEIERELKVRRSHYQTS